MLRIQIPYRKVLLNPRDFDPSEFDSILKEYISKYATESFILEAFNPSIQYLLFLREAQPYWACMNDGEEIRGISIREFFLKLMQTQFPQIVIYHEDILLFHSLLVYFQKKPELKVTTSIVDLDEILDKVEERKSSALISARQPGNFIMLRYQKGKPIACYHGFTDGTRDDIDRREEFLVKVYTLSSHRPFDINLFTDFLVSPVEDAKIIPLNYTGNIVDYFTGQPPRLVVKLKNRPLKTYTMNGNQMFIGRLQDNDIVIDNLSVSRKHAVIRSTREGYIITDLGSKNGTFLNDNPIKNAELKDGDVITIGKYKIHFQCTSNEVQPSPDLDQTVIIPNFHREKTSDGFNVSFPLTSDITPRLFRRSKMEEYPLTKEKIVIGRTKDADIKIGGIFGPRVKVEIVKADTDYILQKVDGSSSVKVNGEEMEHKILEEEDLITIGKEEFVFKR